MTNIPFTAYGIVGLQKLYGRRFQYRLHEIELSHDKTGVTATIFDGDRKVHEAHGQDEAVAVHEAKQWIDEQDEVLPAYDLHTAG